MPLHTVAFIVRIKKQKQKQNQSIVFVGRRKTKGHAKGQARAAHNRKRRSTCSTVALFFLSCSTIALAHETQHDMLAVSMWYMGSVDDA
jgi:hypothetical protein